MMTPEELAAFREYDRKRHAAMRAANPDHFKEGSKMRTRKTRANPKAAGIGPTDEDREKERIYRAGRPEEVKTARKDHMKAYYQRRVEEETTEEATARRKKAAEATKRWRENELAKETPEETAARMKKRDDRQNAMNAVQGEGKKKGKK